MEVNSIIRAFDEYLFSKSLSFDSIIIGGAALSIMGVIDRETRDIDCLDPKIPDEILRAAENFRIENPHLNLAPKWINNGPDTLVRELPTRWRMRIIPIFDGKAIRLSTLGRSDLLKTKLFALCDRDFDFQDCVKMNPSLEELDECFEWVSERDGNPGRRKNVENHFAELKKELGYDV